MSDMEERLRAFLKENPDDPMVLMSLASVCRREGRADEAIELLTRAIDANPEYLAAYALLGECREESGDEDAARESYERALELARIVGDATMQGDMEAKLEALSDDAI